MKLSKKQMNEMLSKKNDKNLLKHKVVSGTSETQNVNAQEIFKDIPKNTLVRINDVLFYVYDVTRKDLILRLVK